MIDGWISLHLDHVPRAVSTLCDVVWFLEWLQHSSGTV
jgi:hypothetical protein